MSTWLKPQRTISSASSVSARRLLKPLRWLASIGLTFIACGSVSAAIVTLTWFNPTTKTDGTALLAAQITGTRIEYGTCSGSAFGVKAGEVITTGAVVTATVDRPAGTHCFRAYARIAGAVPNSTIESAPSNVAQKVILEAPPNPPTNLAVQALVAYDITKRPGRVVMLPVGTVPAGTICNGQEAVIAAGAAYYAVPTTAATWYGNVRPDIIYAVCG